MWKWSNKTRCGFVIWHTSTDYIFEENYVQKIKKTRKQVKNDDETSNDGDASTQVQQGTYYNAKFAYGGLEG